VVFEVNLPDDNHPVRILDGQSAKENGIDDTKDRGVSADAEGQRGDRHGAETRTLLEHPDAIAQVLLQSLQGTPAPHVHTFLLQGRHAPELAPRGGVALILDKSSE